jgi:hypothetical protein
MAMKLKVSDAVTFDVGFTLNDEGKEPEFGFRATAKRMKPDDGETIGDFLSGRAEVRMLAWAEGKAVPLANEDGSDVAAGPEALAALYDLVGNMAGIVYAAYLQATNAKARLGNLNG